MSRRRRDLSLFERTDGCDVVVRLAVAEPPAFASTHHCRVLSADRPSDPKAAKDFNDLGGEKFVRVRVEAGTQLRRTRLTGSEPLLIVEIRLQ